MSDEQLILLMAAVMVPRRGEAGISALEAVTFAREMFAENRKLGRLPTQAIPETRKATLSHPTIEERNEAHAARQYDKRRGA